MVARTTEEEGAAGRDQHPTGSKNTSSSQRPTTTHRSELVCSIRCVNVKKFNYQNVGINRGKKYLSPRPECHNSCRKTETIPRKLGRDYPGPLGSSHSSGLQAGVHNDPSSEQQAIKLLPRAEPHSGGNTKNASEGSHYTASTIRSGEGLLLKPIHYPQERRGLEAGDQLEVPKQVHSPESLQDGRNPHPEGYPQGKRLDDKSGSEGCLLHDPSQRKGQIVPPFLVRELSLSVHMPTIWPVLRSVGLYQDPEADSHFTQRVGCQVGSIHRRHPSHGRDGGDDKGAHAGLDLPAEQPGVHGSPGEIFDRTHTGDRVPGIDHSIAAFRAASTWTKTKEAPPRRKEALRLNSPSHSKGSVTPTGEVECSITGSPTRSIILQSDSEGPSQSPGHRESGLRSLLCPLNAGQGGNLLVGRPPSPLEREKLGERRNKYDDNVRCLPHRVGGVFPRNEYGRAVVAEGEKTPHKLPGASRSSPGSKIVREVTFRQTHSTAVGQPNSSSIYKQPGRDRLRPGHGTGQKPLAVVPGTGNCVDSPALAWEGQCSSGLGVQGDEGSIRLGTEPESFYQNPSTIPLAKRRPVCISSKFPTSEVFQLEARPTSRSDECVPTRLDKHIGLRKSSVEPDREGPVHDGGTKGYSGSSSSNLAITTMVSKITQSTNRDAIQNNTSTRSDVGSQGGMPTKDQASSSRVAYLRQHYIDKKLSTEASDLLLASWRQKSSQSYDSLCK